MRVYSEPQECLLHKACVMALNPPKFKKMGRPRRPSIPAQEIEAMREYASQGHTVGETSKKFNRPYNTIRPYIRDVCKIICPHKNISYEQIHKMKMMRKEGATIPDIAETLGCSQSTVRTHTGNIKPKWVPAAGRAVPEEVVEQMRQMRAQGMSNREIGRALGVSGSTVGNRL